MRVPNFLQTAGRQIERLFPTRLAKMRERIGGIDLIRGGLRLAREPHPRLRQAMRMVDVIEAEPPFDAEPVVIGRSVLALSTDDSVVLDVVGDLAADATKWAERVHRAVGIDASNLRYAV